MKKEYETIIVGSGIAGSALAFELEKRKADYLILNDQNSPLKNNSVLSYGHCRLDLGNIEEIVQRCTEMGDDEEKIRFIYESSGLVVELLEELGIPFEYRSFGVIPTTTVRGGRIMMQELQKRIPMIMNHSELVDFTKEKDHFEIRINRPDNEHAIRAKNLVLATGGYDGNFNDKDKSFRLFSKVEKNKGRIVNLDCIFRHPFGLNGNGEVLIGAVSSKGEFMDEQGNYVFDAKARESIRKDSYHEMFDVLIDQIESRISEGHEVFFIDDKSKVRVKPCVHYTSGGIKTDYLGRAVGCEGLFAIGECQADGSKKPGRLPGHPFTAAIVYGRVLAEHFGRKL